MKTVKHPERCAKKVKTSLGEVQFNEKGDAEVSDEVFDLLMGVPAFKKVNMVEIPATPVISGLGTITAPPAPAAPEAPPAPAEPSPDVTTQPAGSQRATGQRGRSNK